MIGGYFRNHPPGTPTATVDIEDPDEPSTEGLPPAGRGRTSGTTTSRRSTRWWAAAAPTTSPRDSGVKVLATRRRVDLRRGGRQRRTDDDHPIAWCSDFDGGRVWYTGMGHTAESFGSGEGNIRQHLLGGLQTVTGAEEADCGEPRQATPSADDFEIVTIDDDTESPMELDVATDGRVFYIERITGEVNV